MKIKKTSNVPGFNDFHKEVPGVKLSESTMEWWLRHRSKLIKKDKFEELVNQYAFDPSIAFLVEPPKAPEPLVAQTKKRDGGRSINSEDKILSSIQRNLLQGIQPLLKLLNETDDTNNKKRSHTQLDSRKQVIAFQDRVITINIKEAQHPLK